MKDASVAGFPRSRVDGAQDAHLEIGGWIFHKRPPFQKSE
jgi:hypothetical protein